MYADAETTDTSTDNELNQPSKHVPVLLVLECVFGFGPYIALPWLIGLGIVPSWTASTFIVGLVLVAATWEIYVTFGLAGGASFKEREPDTPKNYPLLGSPAMNWILMSSLDVALVLHILMMGGALLVCQPHDLTIFSEWRWDVFGVMFAIGYGQGVGVALFHRCVDEKQGNPTLSGLQLSWMPLSPFLPLEKDPVLPYGILKYLTYRIMWCWVFMPIIWNAVLIHGIFGQPIPYPLFSFSLFVAVICLYMIFFVTYFPVQKGVPSIPIDEQNPGASWNEPIRGVAVGLGVLLVFVLISTGIAYVAGCLFPHSPLVQ